MQRETTSDSSRSTTERGQTMAEYAVALAVITPAIIAAIALISGKTGEVIDRVTGIISGS